jgi:hypothetical protein
MRFTLGLIGAAALTAAVAAVLTQAPRTLRADAFGRMPEVLVTASGPRMVLSEVVVRGERSPRMAAAVPGTTAIN